MPDAEETAVTAGPPRNFPIVGVGASAGGVEALEGFFRGVPDQPGLAFVIVTHLSPERESLLHEIVARYTDLAVQVAADGVLVEVDRVYVLPADAILSIEDRRLTVRKPVPTRRERKPIDIFFSALAADCGELAVGVVLSGGDGDGTLGIKAIKERGGLTLAQVRDGYGPQHPDMPNSAISTGFVDFAVAADEMGGKLVEFARSLTMLDGMATASRAVEDDEALEATRREVYAIMHNQLGHDFRGYKTRTFLRRVQRRMRIRQLATTDAYIEVLQQEPQEVNALFRDLLISVTNFFRDTDAFENLAAIVLPKLFEGRGAGDVVRVWVPGCATGEEVFTISMLLCEQMDRLTAVPRVQVFATDIDEHALGVARAGRYPAALLNSVSPERRERFFIPDSGSYVVAKEVRDLCIFSLHSVIRDPPFSRIDLVSCRNLLIYFGVEVQNQVIPTFHYALRPGGYLFLGTSENVSQFNDLFATVEKKHRIFQKRPDANSGTRLPAIAAGLRPGHIPGGAPRRIPALGGATLRQSIEGQVLEQFAPPYVVVNRDGDVVFYSARTGKYLEAAAGTPTRQILAIARKGLRLDLRTAFRQAVETGRPVTREGVAVDSDDERVQMITLSVVPVADQGLSEKLLLVLFADQGPTLSREEALSRATATQDGAALHLERELRETRERLQSMIEEHETALEELKSSNEELVSVNEELQSTNEELEASKEELQSVNEELHTVNTNLNGKMEALDLVNSDLQNLFDSTDVATVFLDPAMVIRSFTPAVARIFNILPGDRGRPITDLSSHLNLPNLAEDIAAVLAGRVATERRVPHHGGSTHYLVRIGPYRNAEKRVMGVVLTFLDITSLTQAEARQTLLLTELQHRVHNIIALIRSISARTLDNARTLDEFASHFSGRIDALGRTQSVLALRSGKGVELEDLVRDELAASVVRDGETLTVEGPPVLLRDKAAEVFALALHELATNAVKYGAIAVPGGRVSVRWRLVDADGGGRRLALEWRESGVPVLNPNPARIGFGRDLIERGLPYDLGAVTSLQFAPGGVRCTVELPVDNQMVLVGGMAGPDAAAAGDGE